MNLRLTILALFCTTSLFGQDLPVTPETKDGKLIYESWCARCHGMDGRGEVEGLVLDNPAPDFTDCDFNSREPRKDWKAVILEGGPARGLSMTMPAWNEAMTAEQADAVIAHLKTFCPDPSWPPGELNFRRLLLTEKAFPEDEALMIPTYTQQPGDRTGRYSFLLEQRIGPRAQWELSVPAVQRYDDPGVGGFGDIEVAGKYAFYHSVENLSIVSAGLEITLPTAQRSDVFGGGTWNMSPFIAVGKGFDALTLQSSFKVEFPLKTGHEPELQYNLAVTVPLSDEKQGLFPSLELNGIHVLGEPGSSLFLTPQLYIGLVKRGHLALSIGTQIPVAGERPFQYRIVGFLLWEYVDGGIWW